MPARTRTKARTDGPFRRRMLELDVSWPYDAPGERSRAGIQACRECAQISVTLPRPRKRHPPADLTSRLLTAAGTQNLLRFFEESLVRMVGEVVRRTICFPRPRSKTLLRLVPPSCPSGSRSGTVRIGRRGMGGGLRFKVCLVLSLLLQLHRSSATSSSLLLPSVGRSVGRKCSSCQSCRAFGARLRGGLGTDKGEAQGSSMWITVHGIESDAVTLAWKTVDGAQCYEVQLKVGESEFKTVSDKLSSTMVSLY